MGSFDIVENARIALYALPVVLLAFALHEMAHAYTATWFGDPTPAQHGRRTLNPIRHLDRVGTIMLVVSMLLFGFPFGFAVTPVNDSKMRRPRLHGAIVSFAGPLVNILICVASGVWWVLAMNGSDASLFEPIRDWPPLVQAAYYAMAFNAFLAIFNLLPIPPLDGGRIVGSFMNDSTRREWQKLEQYGIVIILVLMYLGGGEFVQQLQDWMVGHVLNFSQALGFDLDIK